jgi:hypothetical protein
MPLKLWGIVGWRGQSGRRHFLWKMQKPDMQEPLNGIAGSAKAVYRDQSEGDGGEGAGDMRIYVDTGCGTWGMPFLNGHQILQLKDRVGVMQPVRTAEFGTEVMENHEDGLRDTGEMANAVRTPDWGGRRPRRRRSTSPRGDGRYDGGTVQVRRDSQSGNGHRALA